MRRLLLLTLVVVAGLSALACCADTLTPTPVVTATPTLTPSPTPTPLGPPGAGVITPKGDKYELTSQYTTEKVDVDISASPSARIYRWGDEAHIDLSYPSLALSPVKKLENNKVVWQDGCVEIRQYITDDGSFEFEVILHCKPASNKIILDIDTKDIVFYPQPPLTEEYSDGWSDEFQGNITVTETEVWRGSDRVVHRPENVVGSYAVYHSYKKNHIEGQTNYMAGKAFHIPRPQPIDSEGKKVWADLLIENEKATITIPWKFLDEAVYPIYHATGLTFGYTTVGSTTQTDGGDEMTGYFHTSPATADMTGDDITIHAHDNGNAGPFKGVLLTAGDGLIITNGVGTGTTLPTQGAFPNGDWVTSSFGTSPDIAASTSYTIAFISQNGLEVSKDTGDANQQPFDNSNDYAVPENMGAASTGNTKWSAYVNYSVEAPAGNPQIF